MEKQETAQAEIVEPAKVEPVKEEPVKVEPVKAKKAEKAPKKKGAGFAIFLAIVAVILSGTGLAFALISYNKANTPITFLNSGEDGNSINFVEGSIADVADKVSPSVVSILTEIQTMNFFGRSVSSSAAGTGIIVSKDGYILTNKHVIEGASSITVVLDDGTSYENVKVAAEDPLNDVAFLKIDNVSDLNAATLGDSKTLSAGQQVIAIGNALGEYQNTVTSGIISGTGRQITATDSTGMNAETLNDMIQTDAAINSGNSGGPLVNAAGQVIGINTATTTDANNIGFAIPISSVKGMLNSLFETGKAERAYLGIYSAEITPALAKEYELPVLSGAYVYSQSAYSAIKKDGPADRAGLKEKDIIISVNGVKVGAAGSVSSLIGEYKVGDTVQLTVMRGNDEIAINVTLGAYSE